MRPSLVRLAALERLTAAGLILFWLGFFAIGLAPAAPPPGYFVFEHAFPPPDLLLAVAFIAAARRLRSPEPARRESGRTLSLAAAGALVFLGVLDVSFNLQNGMYAIAFADAAVALAINAWCLGFGLVVVGRLWRPASARGA
jgi:hypothetical protein